MNPHFNAETISVGSSELLQIKNFMSSCQSLRDAKTKATSSINIPQKGLQRFSFLLHNTDLSFLIGSYKILLLSPSAKGSFKSMGKLSGLQAVDGANFVAGYY